MADAQNTQVAIPLPENKRKCVQAGCICMMLSVLMAAFIVTQEVNAIR